MKTFIDMGLSNEIISALKKSKITEPTEIQVKTMENFGNNKDIIAGSGTGTGKTLAYFLPIEKNLEDNANLEVIILAPSQELSIQINSVINKLFTDSNKTFKSICLLSDANIKRQVESLKQKPKVIVGMADRIVQLIKMKKIKVHKVNYFVLDEADKLLEKRNLQDVIELRKCLLKFTQTFLFSASIENCPKDTITKICFNEVININVVSKDKKAIPDTISHTFLLSSRKEKTDNLRKIVSSLKDKKSIIFVNDKFSLNDIYEKLMHHKYKVLTLNGNIDKVSRRNILNDYRNSETGILLTTDIAARGLDFDNIYCVINYNLPEEAKEYLHRSGRCGRKGEPGLCISILTDKELLKLEKYADRYKMTINEIALINGNMVEMQENA